VLVEVLEAVWIGALIGVLLKLGSPHPNFSSWIVAALVGGLGAMGGLFVARLLGVNREQQSTTLAVAGGISAIAVVLYAMISSVVVRRLVRRSGRPSRPTIAF